jgi:hypothetical protein
LFSPNSTDLNSIGNLEGALESQIKKLDELREKVRELKFVPIDPMGSYQSVAYKAIDGGRMKIYFDPLELDLIDVADSYGNLKMRFIIPKGGEDEIDQINNDLKQDPLIADFLKLLNKSDLSEISEVLTDSDTYMEIAEWACIFNKIVDATDEPFIVMRDGLLRTKKLKSELICVLLDTLRKKKDKVNLVGVSKTSSVLSLLSTAISIEHIFPSNSIGFVKVPVDMELMAYTWSGKGKISPTKKGIYYSFGDLYIAKLSRSSNLLVTIEIPRDREKDQDIYSQGEIIRIMGHLAKDSSVSYPVLGYPQTIMRAHEYAVNTGFPASVIKDKILDKIRSRLDDAGKDYMRDAVLLKEEVNKGVLGGGHY